MTESEPDDNVISNYKCEGKTLRETWDELPKKLTEVDPPGAKVPGAAKRIKVATDYLPDRPDNAFASPYNKWIDCNKEAQQRHVYQWILELQDGISLLKEMIPDIQRYPTGT